MGLFDKLEDDEQPTIQDIADEFEQVYEQMPDDGDDGGSDIDFDPDDVIGEAEETARHEAIDTLDHIINDSCETEECNEIRDALGLDPNENGSDSDSDNDDSESTESADDDGGESDGDSGAGDADGEPDSDPEGTDDDGSGGSDGEAWDEDTNIFGEPI